MHSTHRRTINTLNVSVRVCNERDRERESERENEGGKIRLKWIQTLELFTSICFFDYDLLIVTTCIVTGQYRRFGDNIVASVFNVKVRKIEIKN
jgi:hypothetical protein